MRGHIHAQSARNHEILLGYLHLRIVFMHAVAGSVVTNDPSPRSSTWKVGTRIFRYNQIPLPSNLYSIKFQSLPSKGISYISERRFKEPDDVVGIDPWRHPWFVHAGR